MALLMAAFTEGDRRNRALGYWGAVGSAVAIVGQLLDEVAVFAQREGLAQDVNPDVPGRRPGRVWRRRP
jgi:hypothetical protein